MKVSELIEKLKKMPQDCKVMIYDGMFENEIVNISPVAVAVNLAGVLGDDPLAIYLEIDVRK